MSAGQRVLRFILIFALLLGIWLLLSGKYDRFHTAWGVAGALALAGMSAARAPATMFPVVRFLLFIPWQLWQIFVSNLRVAKLVLSPGLPIRPRLLRQSPQMRDPRALTLLGCAITLTPGTLTIDIDDQRMIVHALDDASASGVTSNQMTDKIRSVFGAAADGPAGPGGAAG